MSETYESHRYGTSARGGNLNHRTEAPASEFQTQFTAACSRRKIQGYVTTEAMGHHPMCQKCFPGQ